jgi:hypothetical protein
VNATNYSELCAGPISAGSPSFNIGEQSTWSLPAVEGNMAFGDAVGSVTPTRHVLVDGDGSLSEWSDRDERHGR